MKVLKDPRTGLPQGTSVLIITLHENTFIPDQANGYGLVLFIIEYVHMCKALHQYGRLFYVGVLGIVENKMDMRYDQNTMHPTIQYPVSNRQGLDSVQLIASNQG